MTARVMAGVHGEAHRSATATRWVFGWAGVIQAAWAPLVPLTQERLGLDKAALGGLLLCVGLGALLTMPFTGALTARFGFRRVIVLASFAVALVFPLLTLVDSTVSMALALLFFGAAVGMLDVAMNLMAVVVEREGARPMMSGFHARWSIGTIIGAGVVTLLLGMGVAPWAAALSVSAAVLVMVGALSGGLLAARSTEAAHPLFVMPKGPVLMIGLLCLIVYLVEHAVLDWSAVYMVSEVGAAINVAGVAYTVFAVAMTLGRLTGDRLRVALGDRQVLALGGTLGAAGLLVLVMMPSVATGLVGFAVLGFGAANIVPVLFSVTGRTRAMPATLALTAVATFSHFGALGGPALVGFVAQAEGLKTAFLILALGMALVAFGHRIAPRHGSRT